MGTAIRGIRLLLLVLSFLGYIRIVSKKIRPEFAIGIVFAGVSGVLMLAGILNLLQETALVLFAGGLAFAVRSFVRRESIRDLITPGTLFFAVLCMGLLLILYGSRLFYIDSFTHWGLVVDLLESENRFPNFADRYIWHDSYPLGSAAFIYYITRISGMESEWMQLVAQGVLMGGMLTGLFAFSKNRIGDVFAACSVLMLLCGNTALVDLLVDTLLPICAIGAIAFCHYYRDQMKEKVLWLIPYGWLILNVKNSGVLFVVIVLLYALLEGVRDKKGLANWVLATAGTFFMLLLWQRHIEVAFGTLDSRHALSLSQFERMFNGKTPEELRAIADGIVRLTFSLSNGAVWALALAALMVFVGGYALDTDKKRVITLSVWVLISYAAYQVGLAAMYMCSMPIDQARDLLCYDRYHQTALVFIVGLLCMGCIEIVGRTALKGKRRIASAAVSLICLMLAYGALQPNLSYYARQNIEGTARDRFDRIRREYNVWSGGRYLILIDEKSDDNYLNYLSIYLLNPIEYRLCTVGDMQKQDEGWKKYEFLIAFDQTEEIDAFIEEQLGQSGQRVYWLPSFF